MLEERGLPTTVIALVLPQVEKTRPPRALMTPFMLGRPLGEPLKGHDREVHGIAISRDGKRIVSVGAGAEVRLWSLDAAEHANFLCDFASRDLSQAEWDRYVGSAATRVSVCPKQK